MAYKNKMLTEESKKLWKIIREIIREHHSEIISKSDSLRDSFYIVRRYLANDFLPVGKITQEMYDFFDKEDNAYRYFTQDLWTSLEREGYTRPEAKPIGILYWKNYEYTIDKISAFLPQIRGFIYVEKDGIAEKIRELSNYGWGVVAAQGQATRQIRKLIKGTGKTCIILHDYDPDGDIISESIINPTRRTSHLDISLGEQAMDLAINDKQADFLLKEYDVPTQPLPTKWQGKWKKDYRIELSAFTVIETDSGNSVLDFTKAEIKKLGLSLSLEPLSKHLLFQKAIKNEITWQIESIVDDILKSYKIEGEACRVRLKKDIKILKNKDIISVIKKAVKGIEKECDWTYEDDMEEEALEDIPSNWLEKSKEENEKS